MKLNSIASRVFFGVFTIILVLCGIVGINMSQHTDINHYSKQSFNQEVPATQLSLNIKYQLAKALESLRGWSSIGDYFYKQDFFAAWQEINRLKDEFMLLQNTDAATVNELSSKLSQLQQAQLRVLDTAQTPENFPGLQMLKVEMEPKVKRLVSLSTELIETESAKPEGVRSYELVKQLADFRFSITTAMSSLRIYLLTKNDAFRIQYQSQWHRNGLSFVKLWRMESLFTTRQRDLMEELESFRQAFEAIPEQVVQLRMSDEWDVAEYSIANNIAELDREAANFIEGIYLNSRKRMFSNLENIKKSQDEALNISVVSLVVGIIICLIITALLTRMIAGPIEQVVSIANNISKGKFDVDTDIKGADEVMLLSTSLSNMLQMLRDVAQHKRQVGDGNFDSEFLPRGEDDQLGNSLQVMTDNLRKTTKYNQLQDWSKTGVAHFTESLQGLTDIEKILPELMNFTGRYFDAQVGALYLLRGGKLVLSASYAYKHRNNLDSEYQLGEGFIGQAALERKSIVFSHLGHDEGQLKIDTGLGLVSPNHIVVSPLIDPQSDEQSFVGVLVLGAEQEKMLQSFIQQKIEIRKELREVRHQLDKDIEVLGSKLKFIIIALMPLLLTLGLAFIARRNRRKTII